MTKLCFATNNPNKLAELQQMVPAGFALQSLAEIGCTEEIPEEQDTIEGNALQKARYVWEHYKVPCFADDTGLEVTALGGEPGVYSARYAGPERNAEANMALLQQKLEGKADRSARFKTVIALVGLGEEQTFEGIVEGEIISKASGSKGFGYDPIFRPEGGNLTFAEMAAEAKNEISHRGRAVRKLLKFLQIQ